MRRTGILMVFTAALFLAGCPYKAEHRLGAPSAKTFDEGLIGNWVSCEPGKADACAHLSVFRFNEGEYYAELSGIEREGANRNIRINTDRYKAFMTNIGVPGLLDVQELSASTEPSKAHFYVKAEPAAEHTIKLSYMSDNFTKAQFSSPEEFAAHLKANDAKKDFYETLPLFVRERK